MKTVAEAHGALGAAAGPGAGLGTGRQYDVAPDGRFLINTELRRDAAPITLILNWQPPPNQ